LIRNKSLIDFLNDFLRFAGLHLVIAKLFNQ
jgi:hypothetical protein